MAKSDSLALQGYQACRLGWCEVVERRGLLDEFGGRRQDLTDRQLVIVGQDQQQASGGWWKLLRPRGERVHQPGCQWHVPWRDKRRTFENRGQLCQGQWVPRGKFQHVSPRVRAEPREGGIKQV